MPLLIHSSFKSLKYQKLLEAISSFRRKYGASEIQDLVIEKSYPWDPNMVFSRQFSALYFTYLSQNNLKVFSFDISSTSSSDVYRKYLVSKYPWFVFPTTYPSLLQIRHYYELIPEGAPCKLYFDIEYSIESNPTVDGEYMLSEFKQFVQEKILAVFGLAVHVVVDLESSTNVKFSRHLIFNLENGILWKNNLEVGLFVKYILSNAPTHLRSLLFVNGSYSDSTFVSVVDQSVYSKNRTFRIWLSSKLGKTAVFNAADSKTKHLLSREGPYPFFLYSLVCAQIQPESVSFIDLQEYLSCSSKIEKNINYPSPRTTYLSQTNSTDFSLQKKFIVSTNSPFPLLDEYVIQGAMNDMLQSRLITIRRCIVNFHFSLDSMLSSRLVLVYDLSGYRYCDIVNRIHNSNHVHIYITIDGSFHSLHNLFLVPEHLPSSSTTSIGFARKCLDPDCKNHLQPDVPKPNFLPLDLLANPKKLESINFHFEAVFEKCIAHKIISTDDIENDSLLLDTNDILSIEYNT